MGKTTQAILLAIVMSAVGILGDYFLKQASEEKNPMRSWSFYVGLILYSSTAFAWVFLMKYLKLATIGVVYSVCMILMLAIMGYLFFNETINRWEMLGICLAILSILLLARFG